MIEAYKIGASLVLDSNVTREMGNIARQFEQLDKIIKGAQRSVNELAASMRGVTRVGQAAADAWSTAAAAMERAARAATRAGQAMPAAASGGGGGTVYTISPAGATRAAQGPGAAPFYPPLLVTPGGAIAGGAGGAPPGLPPGPPIMLPGAGMPMTGYGQTGRGNSNASLMMTLAEVAAEASATREAMREDVSLRAALMSMGFRPGDADFASGMASLRGLAGSSSIGTIFSEQRTAAGMPSAAGVLGFGGSDPASRLQALKKFSAIYPTVLRLGEVAEMMHMGSLEEAMTAAISYAHMTNRYDPDKLEPGLDRLLNIARMTHSSVAGEARTLKYSVPIAQAAGIDADQAATLTGFLQILGFSGTTAGTGLGQLISGLAPVNITKHGANAKAKALQALGLMDAHGQITEAVAPGGHVDAMALLKRIAEFAKSHNPTDVLATFREAFTVRGMRVAGAMENEEAIPRLLRYIEQINNLPGARETQAALAQSPMQSFEQMVSRLADSGNIIATQTLPGLQKGFEGMTAFLEGANSTMKGDAASTGATGYGILGLIVSGALRLGARGLGKIGLGGGAMEGALGAGASAAGTIGGLGMLFGAAGLAGDAMENANRWIYDKMFGAGAWERGRKELAKGNPFSSLIGSANAAVPVKMDSQGENGLAAAVGKAVKDALHGVGIYMDGKKVADLVSSRLADQASRPSSGTNAPDPRMSPWMPGFAASP